MQVQVLLFLHVHIHICHIQYYVLLTVSSHILSIGITRSLGGWRGTFSSASFFYTHEQQRHAVSQQAVQAPRSLNVSNRWSYRMWVGARPVPFPPTACAYLSHARRTHLSNHTHRADDRRNAPAHKISPHRMAPGRRTNVQPVHANGCSLDLADDPMTMGARLARAAAWNTNK
jgi:hypothetical protein